ncbi:MAG: PSD1 and planctomycete cytochrome C domain-containing protein [Isosphaeraceae bacterium]|nr:PSD1 and planctomycete cytochrome C domain-containing protein [Isosphaeraceae bacterium]
MTSSRVMKAGPLRAGVTLVASLIVTAVPPSCPAIAAAAPDSASSAGIPLFRTTIEPVLKAQCYQCHSAQTVPPKGGLRLDSREGLLRGGDTGPAVVPGKSGESLLVQALRHQEGLSMPPKKPRLPDRTVAEFANWVDLGAPGEWSGLAPSDGAGTDARHHWAFQPVRKTILPHVEDASWPRTPVDRFVLARLEERRWRPAPEAARPEWLRRVTFDLTGLPPSPDDVEAFERDASPAAYERVVDRLLASPQYGERWGQHWLDVVRFAETEGYEYDRHIPDAWRYRDYVVRALNQDKPFDRFVTEQLAGDEIAPDDPECRTAAIFHRLGPVRRNAGNAEIALSRNEVLTERTDIIGAVFLGLTVGCARCHNHKLEPIPQKDYYRLQAYLAASEENNIVLASAAQQKKWDAKSQELKGEVERLRQRAKRAKGPEKERLAAALEELEDRMPPPLPTIPSVHNAMSQRTAIHVLKRGVWENKGEPVGPRPLSVLAPDDLPELAPDVPDPRSRLARWLTSPAHPLTARVMANRVWQHHFGAGLVKTVNDFGTNGDRPSHPELLDWLAARLVEEGWRLKPIHRLLVLSSTYRQSSRAPQSAERAQSDPENRLLWRFNRRRLEAEEIRDAMLFASGRLNVKAGGPSVIVPVDPDLVRLLYKPAQWDVAHDAAEHHRRTIYLIAKRNLRLPFLETFDAPPLLASCARRESSTHAPQALELLNGRLSNDLAAAFGARLEREAGSDRNRLVDRAFRLALGRAPSPEERSLSLAFLREQSAQEFALAVFNLNGFVYVP